MKIHHYILCLLALSAAGCGERPESVSNDGEPYTVIASAAQFDREVLKADGVVLVDFWATWCPPCRKMNPVVADAAAAFAGRVTVAKVDVDENGDIAERFQIRSIPTFIIFSKGRVAAVHEGMMRPSQFNDWIEEQLNKHGS